jgi:hypothetical protein
MMQGGAEERADVLKAYERYSGDMRQVMDLVMLAEDRE